MTPQLTPPAGLIGLTPVHGAVGWGIRIGQFLNGDGFKTWEHAFVTLPGGYILEAEPGGAVIRPLHYDTVYWCNGIYKAAPAVRNASPVLLAQIGDELKGTPYSALDYYALMLHRFGMKDPGLERYIASEKHMICSQLVDVYYQRLGAEIFSDHRWNGYVTPEALYNRDVQLLAA